MQCIALVDTAGRDHVAIHPKTPPRMGGDGPGDLGVPLEFGLFVRRHHAADGRDQRCEGRVRCAYDTSAPLQFGLCRAACGVDEQSGPEASHIEVGVRGQRSHGLHRLLGEDVHRVGIDVGAHRGGVLGDFGELADRKHRQIRQGLVGAQSEDGAQIALGRRGAPVFVALGNRRQRPQFHVAVQIVRQHAVDARIRTRDLLTVGEADDHLGSFARASIGRRNLGVAGGAPQQSW